MTTKQISFRIPGYLWKEIEKRKTDTTNQTDIVTNALILYFNPPEPVSQCNTDEIQRLTTEIQANKNLIDEKDKRIRDLEQHVGFLQHEFGKLDPLLNALMPSEEEIRKKKWWQFWK